MSFVGIYTTNKNKVTKKNAKFTNGILRLGLIFAHSYRNCSSRARIPNHIRGYLLNPETLFKALTKLSVADVSCNKVVDELFNFILAQLFPVSLFSQHNLCVRHCGSFHNSLWKLRRARSVLTRIERRRPMTRRRIATDELEFTGVI